MTDSSGFDTNNTPDTGNTLPSTAIIITLTTVGYLLLSLWLVIPEPPVGFYWDDSWYLLMAEWLSGRTEHQHLASSMLHVRQYPPLYSALIAMAGASVNDPAPGFWVNALLTSASSALLIVWLRPIGGLVVALCCSVLLLTNPVALTWLPTLFSEHLFIFLLVLTFLLLERANADAADNGDQPTPAAGHWLVKGKQRLAAKLMLVGVVVGLAMITRSAAVALVLAIAITSLHRHRIMGLWVLAGVTVIVGAEYIVSLDWPNPPNYRSTLSSMLDNGLSLGFVLQQGKALSSAYVQLLGSTPGAVLVFVAMLPGWWARMRQGKTDAWFLLVSIMMIMLWPFPDHMPRLLWPLLPSILAAAASTGALITSHSARRVIAVVLVSTIGLSVHSGVGRTLSRTLNPPADVVALSRMHEWTRSADVNMGADVLRARAQFSADMEQLKGAIAPGECVYSELPAIVTAQAHRVALASPWRTTDQIQAHTLSCRYYYLVPLALPGTTEQDVRNLSDRHQPVFRSPTPRDPSQQETLGVLLKLIP
ncbi:MAG: hypothetical protein DHS20C11_00520 [Lysobacteraceae bacterium]|nr:MAG: hypothetical protein DHS20C11_00520 [Xanthomonadaceae bacterium]